MYIVRPIKESDLKYLVKMAESVQTGLTTLPNDAGYLKNKITDSLLAFDPKIRKPGGESYLFVLEERPSKKVVGVCGIVSKVGGFEPFYTYKIKTELSEDKDLKVRKELEVLHLVTNHNGPSEICSLYIFPENRKGGLGRLLSLSRFLFMARFKPRFEKKVISELRGVMDENNLSPFWETVGRHFFETDFTQVDLLTGLGHRSFIKNLMPRHPIYITLLPKSVQSLVGKVNQNSEPALALLKKEGFVYEGEVDIFDAGPTVSARLGQIRTVRERVESTLASTSSDELESEDFLVTNTKLDFRATIAKVQKIKGGGVCLTKKVAALLNLEDGDELQFVALK